MIAGKITLALISMVVTTWGQDRTTVELPSMFEKNVGQMDPAVAFTARGFGYTLHLTATGAVFRSRQSVVKMDLIGADPAMKAVGVRALAARVNYLIGADPEAWHTDVPTYAAVEYRNIYPGISLTYYGNREHLEYDFGLAPGADPARIRLRFEGMEDMHADPDGSIVVRTADGRFRHCTPRVYQLLQGRRKNVTARYSLRGVDEIAFEVGDYDRSQSLTVDPVIVFDTYLGGRGNDAATAVAVDTAGCAYVAGWTESLDLPGAAGSQLGSGQRINAFVAKLSAAGNSVVYLTYLGGSLEDRIFGIAVDAAGSAVVTGWTYSTDFYVVNPVQRSLGGGRDAFIAKLNLAGNALLFSTYWGGSGNDGASAVALDLQGNSYVTGGTDSTDFPVLNAFQAHNGARQDAFVAKFSALGALQYSTYLGGIGDDAGTAVAVDLAGNAYVTGSTDSINFPTMNPIQSGNRGGQDVFVAKLNAAGTGLLYSTYLGGSGGRLGLPEMGTGIAVDSSGSAYVTGRTSSLNFPIVNPRQAVLDGGEDAFVLKLNSSGSALVYSTYLGGSSADPAMAIGVDNSGSAYVTGYTASLDFPTTGALQSTNAGGYDLFVAKLSAAGNSLDMATYLGGKGSDTASAIALDASGKVYVAGQTVSSDFPTNGTIQAFKPGTNSAFVLKLAPFATANPQLLNPAPGTVLNTFSVTFTWSGVSGAQDYWIDVGTAPAAGNILAGFTGGATSRTVNISNNLNGRTLYVQLYSKVPGIDLVPGTGSQFQFATVASNLALGKTATQSSTALNALGNRAVDGNTDGNFTSNSVSHTNFDASAWWQVDLATSVTVSALVIWNRTDCCGERLSDYWVFVSSTPFAPTDTPATLQYRSGTWSTHQTTQPRPSTTILTGGVQGQYVRVQLAGTNYLSLGEVQVIGTPVTMGANVALGKTVTQSSTALNALGNRAVDGNTDGNFTSNSVSHTNFDANGWWQVDLATSAIVNAVVIWNRTDCCGERLSDYWVFVSSTPFAPTDTPATLQYRSGTWSTHQTSQPGPSTTIVTGGVQGQYVRVQLNGTNYLSMAEVQVLGIAGSMGANVAVGKTVTQSSTVLNASGNRAVDGNTDGNLSDNSVTHTSFDANAWWQVDLAASAMVNAVVIWNRTDCCGERLSDYWVFVSNTPFAATDTPAALLSRSGTWSSHQTSQPSPSTTIVTGGVQGRYIRVQLTGTNYLSLAEVQVIGTF